MAHTSVPSKPIILPGFEETRHRRPMRAPGHAGFNKTGSTSMCCGDMGILVAKGHNGASYPYAVIGIIDSGKKHLVWILDLKARRADVIPEVSNLVYLDVKARHSL